MKRALLALTLICLSATPLRALSCMAWQAEEAYRMAAQDEARYLIAEGAFLRLTDNQTLEDMGDLPSPYRYQALFQGRAASRAGFRSPVELEVEITTSCAAHWCGPEITDGAPVLVFLRVDEDRVYHLENGPCPLWLMPAPNTEIRDTITACMRDLTCEPHSD